MKVEKSQRGEGAPRNPLEPRPPGPEKGDAPRMGNPIGR